MKLLPTACSAIPFRLVRHASLLGQTAGERQALKEWGKRNSILVEIGVAEGASTPFILSRSPAQTLLNELRIERRKNRSVVWVEKFSFDAVIGWKHKIDFLLLD